MESNEKLTKEQLCNLYNEWLWKNPEDECLRIKALEFEEDYFEDMLFKEGSICYDIYEYIDKELEPLYLDLCSNYYRFFVVDALDNALGEANLVEHTISILDSCKDNKSVILHEMIHAYEQILEDTYLKILAENLLLRLYNKLKTQIEDLDSRINEHSEIYGQSRVANSGGEHGLLFYLKSLDLDIRCGFPLGTVCGYGRDTGEMWY